MYRKVGRTDCATLPVNINCGNAFSNTLQDEWWIYEELLFIM